MSNYSFVIPVYNEEETIEKVINEIENESKKIENINDYEIIIVDDNSNDKSHEILKNLKNIKYIKNLNNFGYGYSLKKGIKNSSFENIIILDGDGTYPVSHLNKLIEKYNKGFDLIVGKRTGKNLNLSPFKKPMRFLLKFIVEFATGNKIEDINSGFRIFKKDKILNNIKHLSDAFSFTTSMTMTFIYSKFSISYVDIPYNLRDKNSPSKVRLFKDSLRTLQYIIKIVLFYDKIKLFVLISFLQIIFFLILLLLSFYSQVLLIPSFLILVSAVITFCIGMLSETYKNNEN